MLGNVLSTLHTLSSQLLYKIGAIQNRLKEVETKGWEHDLNGNALA
jgi:hypothetical protein